MKRLALVAGIAVLSLAAGTARGAAPAPGPLLGIVGDKIIAQQLVRFDPALRQLPGEVPLAAHKYGWSFSPDGARLALGSNLQTCTRAGTTLRLVDVGRMQSVGGDLKIASGGAVQASAWLSPNRIVAVVGAGRCGSATQTRIVAVDVATRRVIARTWVGGTLISTARAPGKLVLLLAPRGRLGSAQFAVVDATGAVRARLLEAVGAGQRMADGRFAARVATPGLAVDPAGRAFVLAGWEGVTEIDLKTFRVGFHPLTERKLAKGSTSGTERAALWLGNGLLALTGSDSVNREVNGTREISTTPAGLRILDTRTWKYRALDPQVSSIRLAGTHLLATGSSYSYDGRHSTSTFTGIRAYSRAGHELYRVFEGLPIGGIAAIGGRGYATVGGAFYKNRTVTFDLATGGLGRSLDRPLWELLL